VAEGRVRGFLLLIAICIACKPATEPAANKTSAAGPTVRANVISIRTVEQPEQRTLTHTIVVAGDRARDTSEHDVWRLFDTKANTVTFVDDIARTYRIESLQALLTQRRAATSQPLPPHYPRAKLVRPGTKKPLQGATAELMVIETGAYKRELWLGEHPAIPRGLFAMMHASEPPTLPLAPMMRHVDEVLMTARGFPLADRSEVPNGKARLVVDRSVTGIAPKDVPEALFAIPRGYRDLSPATAAPARPTSKDRT